MKLQGQKEFHELLAEIKRADGLYSIPQFMQLCKDTHMELFRTKNKFTDIAMIFKVYYNMDQWSYHNVHCLGKFIKHGNYLQELENYTDVLI